MIEIVCPSCQARYQLPEGSIGPEGRKVSCSSCSHKWRASVEGAESAPLQPVPEQPEPEQPAPEQYAPVSASPVPATEEDAKDASMAAVAASGAAAVAQSPLPPAATGDREEQMAAIRQMLADLKEGADAATEIEPEPTPKEPVAPPPSMRRRAEDDEEERDALKSRIDELDKTGRAAKGEAATSGYDPAKLRRMHEKRAKKLQRSRERKKKSGAFLTGFTLVALVTATMVGLYVLRPQIVTTAPQMGPALNEYVVTIDRYRVDMNEATTEWKAWLVERIGGLTGKEKEG